MPRPRLPAALLALLAAPAAQATDWRVLPTESRIAFEVEWVMAGTIVRGAFPDWRAAIHFDPARPEQARVVVEVGTGTVGTGDPQTDRELHAGEWMAVRSWPEARFETQRIRRVADGRYEAEATLRLRDVTRPVTLPFTLAIAGDRARMEGEVTLDRTDFAIGDGPDPFGQMVAREVKVRVEVTADRPG